MPFHGRALGELLIAEGIVPPTCRFLDLQIPADGPIVLRYECFLDRSQIPALVRALATLIPPERPELGEH